MLIYNIDKLMNRNENKGCSIQVIWIHAWIHAWGEGGGYLTRLFDRGFETYFLYFYNENLKKFEFIGGGPIPLTPPPKIHTWNHWPDLNPDLFCVQLCHGVGFPACLSILSWKQNDLYWFCLIYYHKTLSISKEF